MMEAATGSVEKCWDRGRGGRRGEHHGRMTAMVVMQRSICLKAVQPSAQQKGRENGEEEARREGGAGRRRRARVCSLSTPGLPPGTG